MDKRDLFCREALEEIVDEASMRAYRNHMILNTSLCALGDIVCVSEAAKHASEGNYAGAFTLTVMGALNFIIGYYEARRAHVLSTASLEDLKPEGIKIDHVHNPIPYD